jgi:hypothetical protein
MLGADLIQSCRVCLHDTDYQTSTDGRQYADEEIRRALIMARAEGLKYIYGAFEILGTVRSFAEYNNKMLVGPSMPPTRARITVNKLLIGVASTGSPMNVPLDFWKLECALDSTGRYIPQIPAVIGDPLTPNIWNSGVYGSGGKIYGVSAGGFIYYWSLCSNDMGNATDLATGVGGMPDAFYHAIKYMAIANLIKKERVETEDRYKFFMNLFMRRISTLR